jgi:hypothetical protein
MKANYTHHSERFYDYPNIPTDIFFKILGNSSKLINNLLVLLMPLIISSVAIAGGPGSSITVTGTSLSSGCSSSATATTITYSKSGSFSGGNTFTAQLSNSSGSFASPINIGSVTSNSAQPINATIPSGLTPGTGYKIRVVSSSPSVNSNNSVGFTVNPATSPAVSIAITAGTNPGCYGDSITFSATPANCGSSPVYQWKVNGSNVGTNSPLFSSSGLSDSDVVNCMVTSSTCSSPSTALSNDIAMEINPIVTPMVNITSDRSSSICAGTLVNFSANAANGGSSPSYQWKINGTIAGSNSPFYSSSALVNNDVITCVLTSNAACISTANANSNDIIMIVNSTPEVSANASGLLICSGYDVMLYGDGASSYSWSHGVSDRVAFIPSSTQTYTVTGTTNGCSDTAQVTVIVDSCAGPTQLSSTSCGTSGLSISSYIYCTSISGATDYEFTISNSSLGYSQVRSRSRLASICLNSFTGLRYGETYNVNVRAKVAGIWGQMGPTCQITLMPFPGAQLASNSCGASNLLLSSYIYAEPVPGANEYEFTISNAGLGYSQIKSRLTYSSICLNSYTGLMYGETYNVNVRAKVSGSWGPVGSTCQITLNTFPATQLNSNSCGATGLSLSSTIFCDIVSGASDYEFTISNSSLGYSQVRTRATYAAINLNSFTGLMYGQTYDVTVRAKVSGAWSSNGATCQIILMPFPETQLNSTSCGASLSESATIYCVAVPGASEYEFTINNNSLSYSQVRTRTTYAAISLTWFSGLVNGQIYDVTVRAKVSGVWGPIGNVCQISLAPSAIIGQTPSNKTYFESPFAEDNESGDSNTSIKLYPNPVSQSSTIILEFQEKSPQLLRIFDLTGKLVYEKLLSIEPKAKLNLFDLNLNDGLYNFTLSSGSTIYNHNVLITK